VTTDLDDFQDKLDVDVDLEEVEPELDTADSSAVDMEAKEATVVKPFQPGDGYVKDETHTFVLEDDSQFSVTVQKRPECPSCQHVLADSEEPNQLSGACSICNTETCHRCRSTCDGCGTLLCPSCTSGHGLKDGTYCSDCLVDVDEDVEFERELELREQGHEEELDLREQELKEEKERTKLELQEAKQQREEIRQDWKVVIQMLDTLQDKENTDSKEQEDAFGSSGAFGGSGAFDGSLQEDGSDEVDEWFDGIEQEIDQQLQE
jgi:hypothetical protein